jgi:hypothetical protein
MIIITIMIIKTIIVIVLLLIIHFSWLATQAEIQLVSDLSEDSGGPSAHASPAVRISA